MKKVPRQRQPLAAYRLRREIDRLDAIMNRDDRPRQAHPLFEASLEVYADWAQLRHPAEFLYGV